MKILITGAGMIGCYLARELAQQGDEIAFFELNPVMSYIDKVAGRERVKVIRGDTLNLPDLMQAVKDSGAERIVHTAALLGASVNQSPYTGLKVNVDGTVNVVMAARFTGVKRVVYACTSGIYRLKSTAPMTEDQPFEGWSLYSATKVAAEQIGLQYARAFKIDFISLRYATTYGPAFSAQGSIYGAVIQELITKAAAGQPVVVQRSAPFLKENELAYTKDVAHGTALALKAEGLKHNIFNIGSGEFTDLEDLAAGVRKLIPKANIKIEEPGGPLKKDPYNFPMDISRAKEELGYKPRYGTNEALKDYLDAIRQ